MKKHILSYLFLGACQSIMAIDQTSLESKANELNNVSSAHTANQPSISQLLAKEVIKLKVSQQKTEQTDDPHILLAEQAKFELFAQKNGIVCFISNFYIDIDLAMDALKIQAIKKNAAIYPFGQFPILAQLRVTLFEMIEENNNQLEPKKIDAHTISRYLIGTDQEQVLRCITCLSAEQFDQCTQEALKELTHEQKNSRAQETDGYTQTIALDEHIIKKILADMQKSN